MGVKENNKKVNWGQLILGIIGIIAGTLLMVNTSGTGAALFMVVAIIIILGIYLAVKNNK